MNDFELITRSDTTHGVYQLAIYDGVMTWKSARQAHRKSSRAHQKMYLHRIVSADYILVIRIPQSADFDENLDMII